MENDLSLPKIRMPYDESDGYIDELIARSTEKALTASTTQSHPTPWGMMAAIAAAAAVTAIAIITAWRPATKAERAVNTVQILSKVIDDNLRPSSIVATAESRPATPVSHKKTQTKSIKAAPPSDTTDDVAEQSQSSPLDNFLNSISDEEAQVLTCFVMEDFANIN